MSIVILRGIRYSASPRCGGGSDFGELSRTGCGGERRLTFPPPFRPSPIKGEGVRFFDCSHSENSPIPTRVEREVFRAKSPPASYLPIEGNCLWDKRGQIRR